MPYRTIKQIESDPRVQSVSDERNSGEGVWVYLHAEYISPMMGCGTIHEDTVRDCAYEMQSVVPRSEVK